MALTDPDLSIWQRAQRGDQAAYDMLRRKYRPLVRGEIRKRIHGVDQDDLEDLEQGAWVAAWKALPNFRGASLFSTWLAAVTKNTVFEWLRKRRVERDGLATVTADMRSEPQESASTEVADRLAVRDALKKLSEREREAIYFCVVKQLTHEEAAARLGAPLGTLKSRVRMGLKKLQTTMHEMEREVV